MTKKVTEMDSFRYWAELNGYKNEISPTKWTRETKYPAPKCKRSGTKPFITIEECEDGTLSFSLSGMNVKGFWVELNLKDFPAHKIKIFGNDTEYRLADAWKEMN